MKFDFKNCIMYTGVSSSWSMRYAPCPSWTARLYSRWAVSFSFTSPTMCFPLINASKPHTAAISSSGKTYLASSAWSLLLWYSCNTTTWQPNKILMYYYNQTLLWYYCNTTTWQPNKILMQYLYYKCWYIKISMCLPLQSNFTCQWPSCIDHDHRFHILKRL